MIASPPFLPSPPYPTYLTPYPAALPPIRRWDATPTVIMIVGAIQLVLSISAFQAPNMSKLIGSESGWFTRAWGDGGGPQYEQAVWE